MAVSLIKLDREGLLARCQQLEAEQELREKELVRVRTAFVGVVRFLADPCVVCWCEARECVLLIRTLCCSLFSPDGGSVGAARKMTNIA
jgi:hypothetical protein